MLVVVDVVVLMIVVGTVTVVVTVVVDPEVEVGVDVPDTKSYTTIRSAVLEPTAPVAHSEEVSVTEIVCVVVATASAMIMPGTLPLVVACVARERFGELTLMQSSPAEAAVTTTRSLAETGMETEAVATGLPLVAEYWYVYELNPFMTAPPICLLAMLVEKLLLAVVV